jgi:hypothetical protein
VLWCLLACVVLCCPFVLLRLLTKLHP